MPKLTTRGIACSLYLMVFSLFVIGSCVKESFSPSQADSFIRFYGSYRHDEGIDVVKLTDGGYAFIGTTITESLNQKIIFYRTDRYGNELWEPGKFGGPFENNAYSFKLLRDGGFAILGSTFVNAKGGMLVSNMYLVRTDERGDSLWTKSYGGFSDETGFDLAETSDGGFVLIGSSEDFEKDRLDIFLVGTDSRGDTLWTRTHGGERDDAGKFITETETGFIYTGYTNSISQAGQSNSNIFIVKTNALGRITHPWTYGSTSDDSGKSIIPLPGGGYLVLGSTINPSTNIKNIFLARVEEDISKPVWIREIGGEINHTANCFKITGEGDIIIVGTKEISAVDHAIFLLKTDVEGNQKFKKTYSGMGKQRANAVDLTDDGGYIIIGSTELGGNSMITLIKTKAGGEI